MVGRNKALLIYQQKRDYLFTCEVMKKFNCDLDLSGRNVSMFIEVKRTMGKMAATFGKSSST